MFPVIYLKFSGGWNNMSKSIIEKLLPDLNSRLKAQGFYLEMLEALIEEIQIYYDNFGEQDGDNCEHIQKHIAVIEKACYPKTWDEIRTYYWWFERI